MSRISNFETTIMLFGVLVLLGVVALAMLSQTQAVALPTVHQQFSAAAEIINWTEKGKHIEISSDLVIKPHAMKHAGENFNAWTLYTWLLEGHCTAVAVFCGPSEIEKLFLCKDLSGRIGGLVVFADEILTGYQASSAYWARKLQSPYWEICDD